MLLLLLPPEEAVDEEEAPEDEPEVAEVPETAAATAPEQPLADEDEFLNGALALFTVAVPVPVDAAPLATAVPLVAAFTPALVLVPAMSPTAALISSGVASGTRRF